MEIGCFALRRLGPFRGTLQVVQVGDGRAFSADGVNWKVELLSREPVRLPPWGDTGPAAAERRYFTYGQWGPGGLERVPLNAILGDQSGHPALAPLLEALEQAPGLPFPLADKLELWLLCAADDLPLALLRSHGAGENPPPVPRTQLTWRAMAREAAGGGIPAAAPDGELSAADVPALEQQVMRAAGGMARSAQWFVRERDGGRGLAVAGRTQHLEGRTLPDTAFPPLLVREDWEDETEARRMAAYLQRLAPALLTLPLPMARRRALEAVATRHPRRLFGYHRLLPAVADRERVNAALVAARLELAAGGG